MKVADFGSLLRIALLFAAAVLFLAKARAEGGSTWFVWRGGIEMGVFNAWFASAGLAGLGIARLVSWLRRKR